MMIESSLLSNKSKVELKLIGPQSSRNQLRSQNNNNNYLNGGSGIGGQSTYSSNIHSHNINSNSNNNNYSNCNTSRGVQNVTPKRQNSNHNTSSNTNLNTPSNNFGSIHSQPQGSLNAQLQSRLQGGNSYLNKPNSTTNTSNKLNNQNFTKKTSGLSYNSTSTTTMNKQQGNNLNNNNNNNGQYSSINQGNSSSNIVGGGSFSQDKMNTVMKNNMSRQKNNQNMHMTHKNQILQHYQASKQQVLSQMQQQQMYQQQQQLQNQQSTLQLNDLPYNPSSSPCAITNNQSQNQQNNTTQNHLSPSTSQSHMYSNENNNKYHSYLNKPTPHSYLSNQTSEPEPKPSYRKYGQNSSTKGDSGSFYTSTGQSNQSNYSKSKCLTPINEKGKNGSSYSQQQQQLQNSYLKKSQLIITKNQSSSSQMNTSTGNTSFLKQSHSRSPLSTNHIDKENTYLNHFEISTNSINNEKTKRASQIHSQTSQSQTHLQSSPFSYLSSGQASTHLNNLSTLSNNSKSKSNKSPKQSNSLQMVNSSLESPAGNFFSSHLNRKKNLSTANNYNSFSTVMEKQYSQQNQTSNLASQNNHNNSQNQLASQSYSMSTQFNFDQSPISNAKRFNQLDHNQSNDMTQQTNGQNSFLLSSNLKDMNSEFQNKTHDYGYLGKSSGILNNYPNSSRFDQYRSVDADSRNSKNVFPKSYLNIETKESLSINPIQIQKKKNATLDMDVSDLGNGIVSNKFGGIIGQTQNTDNKLITLNEQELSFQNDQDDNIMLLMNQQNMQNNTHIAPGNSCCYGYYNEDESNFLNSTNFLNLTNFQINSNTQNNTMIAGINSNTNNNVNNNNNNNILNFNNNQAPGKNPSTSGSQIILQQQNSGTSNSQNNQFQNNNNNNNIQNQNNNSCIQQNNLNNTLNWTNSTNLFNNSVCAGSMLNTTINNILQNMNSTQSTTAYTMNNTISTTNNNNNFTSNHTKVTSTIYSSLSQQNQNNNNLIANINHTTNQNTPTSLYTAPTGNCTSTSNSNQNQNFSSATPGYGMNQIQGNTNADKLPLDTTPKQVNLFAEPQPTNNVCSTLKSILYDHIMPTIKPITRQFKLLNSHQANNSHGNGQNLIINPNIFVNEQISNQNKQQILQSLTKQFSSTSINNKNINNSSSININNNSNNNFNNNDNINEYDQIDNNNNINKNLKDKDQQYLNINQYQSCVNQNNYNISCNFDESKNQFQQGIQNDNSYINSNGNQYENKSQFVESSSSNQTTPIKIHLNVDNHSVNSFNSNAYFGEKDTPVLKSPYSKSKDDNTHSPQSQIQVPSFSNNNNNNNINNNNNQKQQVTPNPTINVSAEKDQIALQQYNFSFSNCVNQQKKMQQQQQQQQQQQLQQQNQSQQQYQFQQQQQFEQKQQNNNINNDNKFENNQVYNGNYLTKENEQSINQFDTYLQNYKQQQQKSQEQQQQQQGNEMIIYNQNNKQDKNNNNMLINQEHKLVESMQDQIISGSPVKPVINLLHSQQITVVDGIAQVSSQMFQGIEFSGNPYIDQSFHTNAWSIDNFQIGKCLGRGRFGNVYLSRHKQSNMLFAIKQINKKNLIESCMEKQLQQEIKIQSYLNHPNVLKMHGFFDDSTKIYLILELASHGDIYKEIKREPQKKFSEEKAANYIRQVCEGLIYLHSQGIIHRDIKPENILNSYGVLKLSDFGWSIYTEEKRMTFCGTLDYVSPEVVSGKDYDFKVDIWSIGVLTYELITGKPPFENRQNHNEAYQKILMVKYDFPNYITKDAKDFMSKLLVGDPNKRISLEAALNHDWIIKNTRNCLADWDPKVSEESLYLLK